MSFFPTEYVNKSKLKKPGDENHGRKQHEAKSGINRREGNVPNVCNVQGDDGEARVQISTYDPRSSPCDSWCVNPHKTNDSILAYGMHLHSYRYHYVGLGEFYQKEGCLFRECARLRVKVEIRSDQDYTLEKYESEE